jgi:hypothetical protein
MNFEELARAIGSMRIDGAAPAGKGFLCRRADHSVVIITAAHIADAFPVKRGALCDLATGAPIIEATAVASPWGPPSAPAHDVLVFAPATPLPSAAFVLANADPMESQTVYVITELRGSAHRGRVHRGTIATVLAEGALVVGLAEGLAREEATACSGAPIVDERGTVVGMVTGVLEHGGTHVFTGASNTALRRMLPAPKQVITVEDSGDDIALRGILAFFLAGAVTGASFLLHASYEYDSWYPHGLRRFVNQNEVAVIGGLFVIAFVAFYWVFQRRAKRKHARSSR